MTLEGGQRIDSLNVGAIEACANRRHGLAGQATETACRITAKPDLAGVDLTLLRVDGDGQA